MASPITDDARHAARRVTTRSGAKTLTARQWRPLGATFDRCEPDQGDRPVRLRSWRCHARSLDRRTANARLVLAARVNPSP